MFLRNISITENIDSMLPDDGSDTAENLRLLNQSPFLSKVLVILESGEHTTSQDMERVAKSIGQAVGPPWFEPMSTKFKQPAPGQAIKHLLDMLPAVSTQQDLERLRAKISPEAVRAALEDAWKQLSGLTGLGVKQIVRVDPLRFHTLALEKLSHLNLFGIESAWASSAEGIFLSPDEKSVLIVLDPKVSMTDSGGSKAMLAYLEQIIDESAPGDLNSSILSGHVYSAANAATIRKDLAIVLTVSLTGILIIFLMFLRSWQGVLVYAIPLWAILAGLVAVMAADPKVSGITFGFGAVLMGLSVDYGLHVFYALRNGNDPGRALRRVTRPIVYCWLTTAGVFGLLLLSSLPGQRQLAVFTVAGLSAAMILALAVLPVFIAPGRSTRKNNLVPFSKISVIKSRRTVIIIFMGLILGAGICWPGVKFDGRLQALSIVPDDLARAEQLVGESWGNVRGMAMVFSRGADLNSALHKAGDIFDYVSEKLPDQRIISLTPLFPASSEQQAAIIRWEDFWSVQGPELKKIVNRESRDLGSSPAAFNPFFEYISSKPKRVGMENFKALGLQGISDMLISRRDEATVVVSLVPDSPEI
ncbi:MAG: MMPL family transporter, partial [Desulfonatronovibrio sp.]